PSGDFTFTSTCGEVIAASTESRLPSRTRSTSVRCACCAMAMPAMPSDSRATAPTARNPRAIFLCLDNVHSHVGVVRLVALGDVVEKLVGILELARHLVHHAPVEH